MTATPERDLAVVEYQDQLKRLALVAQLIRDIPVAKLLADVDRANSIGPILHPTLWREKANAMALDKKLLEAALPLVKWARANLKEPA